MERGAHASVGIQGNYLMARTHALQSAGRLRAGLIGSHSGLSIRAVGLVLCVLMAGCERPPAAPTPPPGPVGAPSGDAKQAVSVVQRLAPGPFDAPLAVGKRVENSPELQKHAKELFTKQCATCHGDEGRGDGLAAYLIYPKPRDFGEARFRLVSTDDDTATDEDLLRTVIRGMPLSTMPSWRHLSDKDNWALVYYVRDLALKGYAADLLKSGEADADEDEDDMAEELGPEEAQEIAAEMTAAGKSWSLPKETSPLTLEALARGRQLYLISCVKCHGSDGTGGDKKDLVDEKGAPIRPGNIIRGIMKGGKSAQDLAYRILSGMPGTAMPSHIEIYDFNGKEGASKARDLWALVHYVQSMIPTGPHELAVQDRKSLKARRVATVPEDPADPAWAAVKPTHLALMRLWWTTEEPRGVLVRALHDGKRLGLHLSWEDGTVNDHVLKQESFSDAAAVQFSSLLDPPLFTMGDKDNAVGIWQWKAHWQRDLDKVADIELTHPNIAIDSYAEITRLEQFVTGRDAKNPMSAAVRKSAIESLVAKGFGTLTSLPPASQKVTGLAKWEQNVWRATFVRDLSTDASKNVDSAVDLIVGKTLSIGFALWDGQVSDRNGQKTVTIWHQLTIE